MKCERKIFSNQVRLILSVAKLLQANAYVQVKKMTFRTNYPICINIYQLFNVSI
jgi:hypothetical protein